MAYQLQKAPAAEVWRVYKELVRDFHRRERIPRTPLYQSVRKGRFDLLLLKDEAGVQRGYAIVNPHGTYGYALLMYFGIDPDFRGKGLGAEAICLLREYYGKKQGLLIELSRITGEEVQLERRRKFYSSCGFVSIPCDYSLFGIDCALMCLGISGPAEISRVSHLIIKNIYSQTLPEKIVEKFVRIFPNS